MPALMKTAAPLDSTCQDLKPAMTVSVRECSLQPSVRRATVNDAFILHEHCARLARYHNAEEDFHLSLSALRTALTKGPCYALLALDEEGRPAGSAIYSSTFSTWSGKSNLFLEHLFVDPAFRGQGHGKTLLAQLRRLAGTGRIEWSVQASNVKSIQFYESAGAHVHDGWLEMRMEGAQ